MMICPAYASSSTGSHPHHVPKEMMMMPSHSPPNPLYHQQPWPYGGGNTSYQYPYPFPHACCCNHTCYGGGPYAFHPHYFHPHGLYSPFPPQRCSVEPPRGDYDKNSNHDCCEESPVDRKTSDSCWVPLNRPDYCPIMSVPPGYMSNAPPMTYSHDPVSVKLPAEPLKRGGMARDDQFPFQMFWLPSSKNDEVGKEENNLDLVANKGSSDDHSKHAVIKKVIPVKQQVEGTNEEPKSAEIMADSSAKTDKNGSSSRASPKTSRLPPVCLRIDPLPRKKKPNPVEKENLKSCQQQAQVDLKKEEQSEANNNNIENVNKDDNPAADHGDNVVPRGKGAVKVKEKKKLYSEDEAALIIQSVYRGFEVRKSQPLKKLREIYQVRKVVSELRNRIESSESSSTCCVDGVIIGETIMSLLLKLDTIQGKLHPYVREVRKSVVKEVVGLQEKLDSLTFIKSEAPSMCSSPQQPQDDDDDDAAIQNNRARAPCDDNQEHKATESQHHDDTPNLEQQLEKSTESEAVTCENHEEKFDDKEVIVVTECDNANEAHEAEGAEEAVVDMKLENGDAARDKQQIQMLRLDDSSVQEARSGATMYGCDDEGNVKKVAKENEEKVMEELIRELTGRVKDLEKKLSKKKKKIKVKRGRSRVC